MNVLSLFDGISCGMIALERAGISVENYYASEIKKIAIKCSHYNYPNIIHIGDVRNVYYKDGILHTENGCFYGKIDLLIGGSPCQDFSVLNSWGCGLKGENSRLMFEYFRLIKEINPTYFLLENVPIRFHSQLKLINEMLGVKPIEINSSDFSFQTRLRWYWTNIEIKYLKKSPKNFQDYIDKNEEYCDNFIMNKTPSRDKMFIKCKDITHAEKIGCVTRKQDRYPNSGLVHYKNYARFLTTRELELAQTLPPGYTSCLSKLQAQDVIGDGWTVDVIAEILRNIGR